MNLFPANLTGEKKNGDALLVSIEATVESSNEAVLLCRNTGTKQTIPKNAETLEWR